MQARIPMTVVLALLASAAIAGSAATAQRTDVTTVTLVARTNHAESLNAAIASFEQQYPNIDIKPTYLRRGR